MASLICVGVNSYASVADADAFFATSIGAAAAWAALATATKEQALASAFWQVEAQVWEGTKTGLTVVDPTTLALGAPGTGYTVGDVLTLAGGTGTKAKVRVLTIGGGGAVATFEAYDVGGYTVAPSSPATVTGGTGTSATFTFATKAQTASWPRSGVTDKDGLAVDANTVPWQVVRAQELLAFAMTQNPALELKGTQNSNVQEVHAGAVGVTFFAPVLDAGRFPATIQELLNQFMGGDGTSSSASAEKSGFSSCSEFDPKRYQISKGVP